MNIFGRVSRAFSECQSVMIKECDGIVVYEHVQDKEVSRTHIHFYIENCGITIEGLKKRIRKECPDVTKSDWAFNTKDVNRSCITYMSKGELEPCANTIPDLNTDEYKELWEDKKPVGRMYQAKLQYVTRESASEAKKRKNELVEEMIGMISDTTASIWKDNTLAEYDERIIRAIVQVLNDNKVVFSRYAIRDYYDTIMAREKKETFVRQMILFCGHRT